jgi:hypothetical protein
MAQICRFWAIFLKKTGKNAKNDPNSACFSFLFTYLSHPAQPGLKTTKTKA